MDTSLLEPQVASLSSASSSVVIKTEPFIEEEEDDIDFHELPSSPADVAPDAVIDKLFEAVESGDTSDFKRLLYTGLIGSTKPVSKITKTKNSSVKRTLPAPVNVKKKKKKQVTDSDHNILRNDYQNRLVIKGAEGQNLVVEASQLLLNKAGEKQVLAECQQVVDGNFLKVNSQFDRIKPKPSPPQTFRVTNPEVKTIRLDSELGQNLIKAGRYRRRRRRNLVVDFLQGRRFTIEGSTVVAKASTCTFATSQQSVGGVDLVVGDVDIEKEKEIKSDIKKRDVHSNTENDLEITYEYVLNGLNTQCFADQEDVNTKKNDSEKVNNCKLDTDNEFDEFSELVIDCGETASDAQTPTENSEHKEIQSEIVDNYLPDSSPTLQGENDQATSGYRTIKVEPSDCDKFDFKDREHNYNKTEGFGYTETEVKPAEDISPEEKGYLSKNESLQNIVIKTEPKDPSEYVVSAPLNPPNSSYHTTPGIGAVVNNIFNLGNTAVLCPVNSIGHGPTNICFNGVPTTEATAVNVGSNFTIPVSGIGLLFGVGLPLPADVTQPNTKRKKAEKKSAHERFTCDYCPKIFRARTLLGRHVRRVHSAKVTDETPPSTEDRTYYCSICDKTFTTDKSYRSHLRIHSGENQIRCQLCGKLYSSIHVLKRHLEILHTEGRARPFQCSICEYSSTFRCHLIEHLRTHTGEQPYDCPVCNKKFSHVGTMNRHAKQVHNYDTGTASFVPGHEAPNGKSPTENTTVKFILPKPQSSENSIHGRIVPVHTNLITQSAPSEQSLDNP